MFKRRSGMSTQMIVRLDPDLKAKVNRVAKAEGKSVSDVVRELLEDYVKNRDLGSYVDDLWNRIGGKLASRGVGPRKISRAIKGVRAKK
jgi:predicted DNA-binding protein